MMRIRVVMTGVAGSPYYANHYFPDGLSTDAQDQAQRVHDCYNGFATSLRTPLSIAVDTFVPTIDPATGDITGSFDITPIAPSGCTNVNDPLPPRTQLLARWNTPTYVGGRRVQGRTFLPGLCENWNVSGGRPASEILAIAQTQFSTLTTGEDRVGVWSRKNGTFNQVSGVSISTEWSTLASRKN